MHLMHGQSSPIALAISRSIYCMNVQYIQAGRSPGYYEKTPIGAAHVHELRRRAPRSPFQTVWCRAA
ncbi:hypothetical protein PT2222_250110 [Paraburkholderia tropica]